MRFLAADIGGSSARLLLGEAIGDGWWELRREVHASPDFEDFDALLEAFVRPGDAARVACFALAGPAGATEARLTNLPWRLSTPALQARHALRRVELINDFAAQGYGLGHLGPTSLATLQAGQPEAGGVRALIGAGTGLGVALIVPGPEGDRILPGEGGHADFAPQDAEQEALLHTLRATHPRVSLELLLSGHGMERIHRFLAGQPEHATRLPDAAAITAAALAGDATADAALRLFARIYGSTAGNLAVTVLPRGGVYLSGGIAPKILDYLNRAEVLEAFRDKPPMRQLLETIPLHVVLDDHLGLYGAAERAARLARTTP